MLAILIAFCGVFGLAVGSFLNVVVYRVPRGESIVRPRSHCPNCDAPIRDRDNIPIVSWLVLRGRCRDCGAPISPRYLVVELLTGCLFAGVAARLGYAWSLPAYLVLVATLVALSVVDLELMKLPKRIVYPGLVGVTALLALDALLTHDWHPLVVGVLSGAAWFVLFFLMNLASPKILGFGDVRMAPLLGLALGWFGVWYVVLGFFASNLIGAVIGVALLATKRVERRQPVPYGVFLSLGTLLLVYAGPEIVSWLPVNLR